MKTKIFCNLTTVLNERKHLKIVFRSVPDSDILFLESNLDRSNRPGLTALHRRFNFELNGASTFLECSSHHLAQRNAREAPQQRCRHKRRACPRPAQDNVFERQTSTGNCRFMDRIQEIVISTRIPLHSDNKVKSPCSLMLDHLY